MEEHNIESDERRQPDLVKDLYLATYHMFELSKFLRVLGKPQIADILLEQSRELCVELVDSVSTEEDREDIKNFKEIIDAKEV